MNEEISEEQFNQFSNYLETNLGLYYTPNNIDDLKNKMAVMAKEFGYDDIERWIEDLVESPLSKEKVIKLAKHLSIGETYFFRDAQYFQNLEKFVVKPLMESPKKEIKVWSAACSTGEESYSLAILFDMSLHKDNKKITIIGTDFNPEFLEIAKIGKYRDWSFRGLSSFIKNKYFIPCDMGYEIKPEIRSMVSFAYLNLSEGHYPSVINDLNNFDLIVCNNVFIYFSLKQINYVIERMVQALHEGGFLCVTPIEAPFINHRDLHPIEADHSFFFQKKSEKQLLFKPLANIPIEQESAPEHKVEPIAQPPRKEPHQPIQNKSVAKTSKEDILKDRANRLARIDKQEKVVGDSIETLTFHLANETYAIEAKYIKEVHALKDYTPLPCVPSFVYGLINIRRRIYSIIDLRPLFDLPILKKKAESRIIILKNDQTSFALIVDRVIGLLSVQKDGLQHHVESLNGFRNNILKGITKEGLIILDGDKLLTEKSLIVDQE